MSNLRIERFSNPAYLAHVAEGEGVPAAGWAIRFDGNVYFDGVQVGHSGKYMFSSDRATPYAEITYEDFEA